MLKRILLVTITTCLGSIGFAESDSGLFVEPSVTYETSKFDVNYPFANSSGETNGFGVGARLGMHVNEVVFLGVDGRFSKLNFQDTNSVFDYDTQANQYNLAPVVGVQMPHLGLRVWGSYIAMAEMDPKEKSGLDLRFKDGTGYRIGAGFHIASVSVNLEYQNLDYDTTSIQQIGPITNTATDGVQLKNESWIASVSFPISL